MGLSRQSRKVTYSSIATIWKGWNLIALPKVRKWNLSRVRDVMVVRKPIRCDLSKLRHPMLVEMTKAEMAKAKMTKVEMTRVEVRTRAKHRTTHIQGLITLNP